MKQHIIGIHGAAGSGKDTAAHYLTHEFGFKQLSLAAPLKDFCGKIFGFTHEQLWGSSIYRNTEVKISWDSVYTAADAYGVEWLTDIGSSNRGDFCRLLGAFKSLETLKDGWLSPRTALQYLGTEFARTIICDDVWLNYLLRTAKAELARDPRLIGIVVSDVRFRNELHGIKDAGGKLIHLDRAVRHSIGGLSGHASEADINCVPRSFFDVIINNNRSLDNLYEALVVFVECQP